ncbi:asialoglycoprotein receptor 2-like [Saccostrea cucullata]|uniref:asialoglycoprotein receptor 2-like n=1 Tax=Saccostrea cuccullata TaxID=36930 RepID=UPI002ED5BE1B
MGSCSYNKCSREEMCVELNSSPVCVKLGCRHKQYTFDEMTKTCFRILTTPLLRWRDASEYCKQDGARLIKLDTREKNDLITEALINVVVDSHLWTGYHDHGDLYYWNDGSELRRDSYKNWGYLQPDNNDPDCNAWRVNCITIQNNGKWFDSCCNLEKGFICEII